MSLARDLVHDVRAVNRHLGRLRFLLETANIFPDEREIIVSALDDMTAAVGNLETASAAAIAEIASLTSAENETALEALVTRVNTVTSNLTAAVPAPATPAAPAT